MSSNLSLALRAWALSLSLALLVALAGLAVADPVSIDICDGTEVGPNPGGLCGSAMPCPTIYDQAACLGDGVVAVVCRTREYNLPGCVQGKTKSTKCKETTAACTVSWICTWEQVPGGTSYCECGTQALNGADGKQVMSLQPKGYYVTCIEGK